MQTILNLDYQLFQIINSLAGKLKLLDYFGIFCAKYLIWVIFGAVLGWWVSIHKTKSSHYWPIEGKKKWLMFGHFSLAVVTALLINQLLALIKFRGRPFFNLNIHKLISHPLGEKSFPSDHTTAVFAISMVVFFYNKKLGSLLLFLSLLVGVSRIYVGVHYPIDVLGGIIIGIITATCFNFVFRKRNF